ncbi:hypothetical protein CPB86DRAFT_790453 [Serendipita vermifera]|nr:hypothetical protein CPB86DRAFT_790453 [Serendipita vermifera]
MDTSSTSLYHVPLSKVLPVPYQIVYASLLLAFSAPVTFAGAFLTLDRTRSFAPSNLGTSTSIKKKKWRLEGGIGGLLGGWIVGVHTSTLLALVIMNRTSSAPLGGIQFLVVWLFSALALSVLAGSFKIAALLTIGFGGGAGFAMFISVICHPAQQARVILLAIFSAISAILCAIPVPRVQHAALRSAAAWLGGLGIVISISLLGKFSTWADVWARLWVPWDRAWGTSQENGLSAVFIIVALLGMVTDWLLKRQLGECPDEKWDNYLANYAANLPNAHDRPGMFTPSLPFWKKLFNPPPKEPVSFAPDKALLSPRTKLPAPPYQAGKIRSQGKKSQPTGGNSFQPLHSKDKDGNSSASDDSSDEEYGNGPGQRYIPRPWAKRKSTQDTSLSGVTLADSSTSIKGKAKSKYGDDDKDLEKGDVVYSDGESVAPSARKISRDTPGWTPEFIKRSSLSGRQGITEPPVEMKQSKPISNPNRSQTTTPPAGAVPMTPSLMKALDRVSQAQAEAYGGIISKGHTPIASTAGGHAHTSSIAPGASTPGLPPVQMPTPGGGYDWGAFWRKVEDKAKQADSPASTNAPNQPKLPR